MKAVVLQKWLPAPAGMKGGIWVDLATDDNAEHRSITLASFRRAVGKMDGACRVIERTEVVVFDPAEEAEKAKRQPELEGVAP